jgi:hypothetical protein
MNVRVANILNLPHPNTVSAERICEDAKMSSTNETRGGRMMRDELIELINQLRIANKISLTDIDTKTLEDIMRDNPAGQDDQCTPIILVRERK